MLKQINANRGNIMKNPNGPYPGRQLFLGLTTENKPCFVYLVTGRSPESRERKAVLIDNSIRIGPIGSGRYDPLRHYSALKYNPENGVAAVTNGIQTEAVFEMYNLIYNTGSEPGKEYLEKILDGAGVEPDSLHTPRIAAAITQHNHSPIFILGIKGYNNPAKAWQVEPKSGTLIGISTYKGDMEKAEARDPQDSLPGVEFEGKTAEDLVSFLFDISAASNKGNDIRVCTAGGVGSNNNWDIVIKNAH
jgi:IMP cyclohydrolase